MASKKTIDEIIDVIVIAVFIIIFTAMTLPLITIVLNSPGANTLANLLRVLNDAYEGNEARYPLILSESNNYNVFGNEVYLTQLAYVKTTLQNEITEKLEESCEPGQPCICLFQILNCANTNCDTFSDWTERKNCYENEYYDRNIPREDNNLCCMGYQNKWKKLFNQITINGKPVYNLETQEYNPALTMSSGTDLEKQKEQDMYLLTMQESYLKTFTNEFVKEARCEQNDNLFVKILSCSPVVPDTNSELTYNDKPIILFPTDIIKTGAEIVEIKITKNDENVQFEKVIKIDKK